MAEASKGEHSKMCVCNGGYCGGGCYSGYHWGFHILRWVLGIIIIMLAFGLGLRIGEFNGQYENANYSQWGEMRHQPMMMEYGSYGMMGGGMRGDMSGATMTNAATAVTKTTTTR